MYKASISDFLEMRIILSSMVRVSEDTKVRYGINKVLDRINKNADFTDFLDRAMDKKMELAKEVDGKIVRDENNEPEVKSEHRSELREWFKKEGEKLMEVEPYIVSCESFKEDIFLIEKLNGLVFQVKIEELLGE